MANHVESGGGDDFRDIVEAIPLGQLRRELGKPPYKLDSRRYFMKKAEIVRYVKAEDPKVQTPILANAKRRQNRRKKRHRTERAEHSVETMALAATEGRSFVVVRRMRYEHRATDQITGRRVQVLFAIEDLDTGELFAVAGSTARVLTKAGRLVGYEHFMSRKGRAVHDAGELTLDDVIARRETGNEAAT